MDMKSPLSPSDVELLIQCHCCPGKHPRHDAPAIVDALNMFLNCGMIEKDRREAGSYVTTEKGQAMIEAICQTAEPKAAWIQADGHILLICDSRQRLGKASD